MSPAPPSILKVFGKNSNDLLPNAYFLLTATVVQYCNSSIMISLDFFNHYFPNDNVKFILPIATTTAQFMLTLLITKLSQYINFYYRMMISLAFCAGLMLIIPFEALYLSDTRFGFRLLMVLLFILSFCSYACSISLVGLASRLPGKYITSKLIGTGLGGIWAACFREFNKLMFAENHELGVFIVFVGGAFMLIAMMILHYKFTQSEFYQNFVEKRDYKLSASPDEEDCSNAEIELTPKRDMKTIIEIFKEIKLYPFLMGLTFVQMFMVFPGVMLSKPMPTLDDDTKVITLNFTFSIFFLIGKKLGQFREYYTQKIVIGVLLFRFVLIANFVLQVIGSNLPILNTVWFAYANVIAFGLTTGFPNCAIFILAPENVSEEKKEVVGFITAIGLATGSTLGVFAALPFKNLKPGII